MPHNFWHATEFWRQWPVAIFENTCFECIEITYWAECTICIAQTRVGLFSADSSCADVQEVQTKSSTIFSIFSYKLESLLSQFEVFVFCSLFSENKPKKELVQMLLRRGYDSDPVKTWKEAQNKLAVMKHTGPLLDYIVIYKLDTLLFK